MLLLDEPTASLDLGAQLDVAALLMRLHRERGATMVMATHDLNLAASLCDTLVLLRERTRAGARSDGRRADGATVRELYGVDADVRLHEHAGHLTVVRAARAARAERPPR